MTSENVIIRQGRCTNQISVYNYPEHLNPFYEDENHKRLRFWKIRKSNKNIKGSSFSLNVLKDIWFIKSFRLKKKSSSLGINKTSESPPPLRHNLNSPNSDYDIYNTRKRNTKSMSTFNNYFENGLSYRHSLQDITISQNIKKNEHFAHFMRMGKYRNTIQVADVPSKKYVYDGSISPQFSVRTIDYNESISQRSSQISLASTNPFECEKTETVRKTSSRCNTPVKSPPRKKYRAPPPPVTVSKMDAHEPSKVKEKLSVDHKDINEFEENINITDLTAEIQDFVKSANILDQHLIKTKHDDVENATNVISDQGTNKSNGAKFYNITKEEKDENTSTINAKQLNCKENNCVQKEKYIEWTNNGNQLDLSDTCLQIEEENKLKLLELKIIESKEDISSVPSKCEESLPLTTTINNDYQKTVNTHFNERKLKMENVHQADNNSTKNKFTSSEQRRYVKEIIKSINRSQSLLKINQDTRDCFDDLQRYVVQDSQKKDMKKKVLLCTSNEGDMIQEKKFEQVVMPVSKPESLNNENNEISKHTTAKKETNREPSPTLLNLDWNPVPKPKRTKNLLPKLTKITSSEDEKM